MVACEKSLSMRGVYISSNQTGEERERRKTRGRLGEESDAVNVDELAVVVDELDMLMIEIL